MFTIIFIIAIAIAVNYLLCTIFSKEIGIPEQAVYNPILAFINGIWANIEKYVISLWTNGGKASSTRIGMFTLISLGGWIIVFNAKSIVYGVIVIGLGVVLKILGEAFKAK